MRAEVTYFEWPDLDGKSPPTGELASTLLVFAAGPVGVTSGETFQVTVCTPEGLAALVARDGMVVGRHSSSWGSSKLTRSRNSSETGFAVLTVIAGPN